MASDQTGDSFCNVEEAEDKAILEMKLKLKMSVNGGHAGDGDGLSTYQLLLKEYNGKRMFWTGLHNRFQCEVICKFKESDLDFPIGNIVSTYLPLEILKTGFGRNHLVTPHTKKRVELDEPLQVLFSTGLKEVTLFLDFGPHCTEEDDEQLKKDKEYALKVEERMKEALKIPRFTESKYGVEVTHLMNKIEEDGKVNNLAEIRQHIVKIGHLLDEGIMDHQQKPNKKTDFYAIFANGILVILAVLYFLYLQTDSHD